MSGIMAGYVGELPTNTNITNGAVSDSYRHLAGGDFHFLFILYRCKFGCFEV